jgi:hypothetical protein
VTSADPVTVFGERVASGARLADEDLTELERADVLVLGMLAETARRRVDRTVSYDRVHVIDTGSAAMVPDIPTAASEVRVTVLPDSIAEATALVAGVRGAAGPDRWVSAFSLSDLQERVRRGWGDLRALLHELVAAGLDDLAELPADRIDDLPRALELARSAGLAARRVTVDRPLGDRRLDVITRVRDAKVVCGGIARFAPLPRRPSTALPTTGYDDLRTVALARLAVNHLISPSRHISIEVDWSLYGPKLAQVALLFGADHLDAVAAVSDPALGPRRATVEDVERNIRAAGFEPAGPHRRAV